MTDGNKPTWEAICYPRRTRHSEKASDERRAQTIRVQSEEDERRVVALADWVLAESLREAAHSSEQIEHYISDPSQRMRADELDALSYGIRYPKERNRLIAAALRRNPTEPFLEVLARLLEENAFTNRSKESQVLTIEQIEFVAERDRIKELLLRAYGTMATKREIERRATDVARHIFGVSKEDAKKAKEQYDDNFTQNAELRWILLTKTIARSN